MRRLLLALTMAAAMLALPARAQHAHGHAHGHGAQAAPVAAASAGVAHEVPVAQPAEHHHHDTTVPNTEAQHGQGVRSPDYSGGQAPAPMSGMHMATHMKVGTLLLDRLEQVHGDEGHDMAIEAEGWYGSDIDKLGFTLEGGDAADNARQWHLEGLWSHALSPWWNSRLGLRHDGGHGPARDWLALGLEGLAPYHVELEATAYLGPSGRSALRIKAGYELLFTQKLMLVPELEANLYGRQDRARGTGAGLADAVFGLRLRYAIQRRFAPYMGMVWKQSFGGSAAYARDTSRPVHDRQIVAGVRVGL